MTKEWKKLLVPDDEQKINDMIVKSAKYRTAYMSADDVKVAQLWCTILEMQKQIEELEQKIKDLESRNIKETHVPKDDELIESHEKF